MLSAPVDANNERETMKITPDDYSKLEVAINTVLEKHNPDGALVEAYETGQFPRSEKVKDLQMRFCFDLLHAARVDVHDMYRYLNDDHVYTALRAICPTVTRRY